MSSFLIACGGTGGHLAPGIALAEALRARGHATTLFISRKQIDARLCGKYPDLHTVSVPETSFSWRPDRTARFFVRQLQGLAFSLNYLRRNKPDVIVGFGGFTNTGIVIAGRWRHVPVALHEANRVPGRAIRWLSRIANRLYLPPGVRLPGRSGLFVRHTGLPVRNEVARLQQLEARAQLGVDPLQKLLVIVGGSQGAGPLNRWVEDNLPALAQEGVQLWCVTGPGKGKAGVRELKAQNGATVRAWSEPFTDRIGLLFSAADLVVSRAGAGTLAELVRCETPAILVPFPHAANNHQSANARFFELQGGGLVVEESSLSSLKQEVTDVLFNDWLTTKFRENLRRMARENTTEAIVQDLEALARGESPSRHLRHAAASAA
jgi:UDP-N-acetylglucosamine--N-acetylmuramyl-(pentapeptide) pyrophosphoryl-undecaprenol N-acetylglucosamine transferase